MNIDFIGVGAARCSTTWLYECLREHPEICMSKKKELHFFDNDNNFHKGINYYRNFFSPCLGERKLGEITPRYMLYAEAMKRIKKEFPKLKLIISLRDPVDRALSQYKYFRFNKKKEPISDIEYAFDGDYKEDYVTKSLYYSQVKKTIELFGADQVLIIFDFEIQRCPELIIKKIFKFLDVDTSYVPKNIKERVNYSQVGFYEPAYIWAKLNQFQKQSTRQVCGKNYGVDRCPSFLKPLLRNIVSYKIVNKINVVLDENVPKKTGAVFDKELKKKLHDKYFKNDICDLEHLIHTSLDEWKEKYE
jgi:hypothetical protein